MRGGAAAICCDVSPRSTSCCRHCPQRACMAVKPSYIAMFICSLGGKKQLTLSRLENGLHELVGDFWRERRIGVGEGVFPQRDCSFVAGEVLLAVRANAKVTIEACADGG